MSLISIAAALHKQVAAALRQACRPRMPVTLAFTSTCVQPSIAGKACG